MEFGRIKEWFITAIVGASLTLVLVFVFTFRDSFVKESQQRRDEVVAIVKQNQREGKALFRQHIDERKNFSKEENAFIKEIKNTEKKEKFFLVKEQEKKKKFDLLEKNIKNVSSDKEKILFLEKKLYLLQDLILEKDNVLAINKHLNYQQKNYISILVNQKDLLFKQNDELQLKLTQSYRVQNKTVATLNENMRGIYAMTARDKAMKIGMGIGLPLALVGGFFGGFYLYRLLK